MSSSETGALIRKVRVTPRTVRVEDRLATGPAAFVASTVTADSSEPPRTWRPMDIPVEHRLREFECRHESECREAFERGRLEGLREAEQHVALKLEAAAEPWRNLAAAVHSELAAYREELYRGTTELAAALARAWLGAVVELNPSVFEAGLRLALQSLGEQEQIEVKLHPEDYEYYIRSLRDPDAVLWASPEVALSADPSVDRGGAIATSRGGSADARISVRVQKALEWLNLPHETR